MTMNKLGRLNIKDTLGILLKPTIVLAIKWNLEDSEIKEQF